ncbi:MAG: glycosyltransferase family 2 protein, partial [Promethearchaeota archaeon]
MWTIKQKSSPFLVVMAALNEEQGIGPTIKEIKRFLDDPVFLVIDGRSVDRTIEIAKNLDVEILAQRGRGKGDAVAQGIKFANFEGKYVVMIDSDFTYPAKFIPQMVKVLDQRPRVGMVCGNRFNDKYCRRGMKRRFFIGNQILALTHNLVNGVQLKDPLTGLRVVRWDILKKWSPKSLGFDIEVELNYFVEREGYDIVEVPIGLRPRLGKKKLNIFDGL